MSGKRVPERCDRDTSDLSLDQAPQQERRIAGGAQARVVRSVGKHEGTPPLMAGDPVDATVTVKGFVRDAYQPFGKASAPLGNVAWLRIGDRDDEAIDVIVNDHREQALSPPCFTAAGLDITTRRALIVKSIQHFYAAFQPIAEEILYVSAPGTGPMDMRSISFTHVTRPLWPRVTDPFAGLKD